MTTATAAKQDQTFHIAFRMVQARPPLRLPSFSIVK
jgi:hypothetical protein